MPYRPPMFPDVETTKQVPVWGGIGKGNAENTQEQRETVKCRGVLEEVHICLLIK